MTDTPRVPTEAKSKPARFRFAIGTVVTVVDDKRYRRRIIERRYMHQPPKNDVYWLNRPVQGFKYFNGDDLVRVKA